MKKLLGILVLGFLLVGCGPTIYNTKTAEEFESIARSKGAQYTARAQPIAWITAGGLVEYGSKKPAGGFSHSSQQQANQIALDMCHKSKNNCIITKENGIITYEAKSIIDRLKEKKRIVKEKAEEKKRIAKEKAEEKEKAEKKEKFPKLEAKHGVKCKEEGFVKGTTEYKDCIYEKEKARIAEEKKRQENAAKIVAGSGTAFFIDNNGHLITNFHVVEKCYDQSKIVYKTDEYDTKLIAKDKFLDLALLKANVQNNKFIIISNKPPKKLKRIIVAGYPFGKDLSDDLKFNSGIITSLKGLGDDSTRIQIDAAVNPGNSGGPIVYEENGLLAAVAVAGLRKDMTESVNFGIKGSSLRNFLEANQLNLATIEQKFSFDDEDLAELLEGATVYTYCE